MLHKKEHPQDKFTLLLKRLFDEVSSHEYKDGETCEIGNFRINEDGDAYLELDGFLIHLEITAG